MSNDETFGSWIKKRRKGLGLTQNELAERVGCAKGTIHNLESDEYRPSKKFAEKLAQGLEIPPSELRAFINFAREVSNADPPPLPLVYRPPVPPPHPHGRPSYPPAPPTSLVGRDKEVRDAITLLRQEDLRLLTLTGPGGTGKTHLALQLAAELRSDFEDGIFFAVLDPIHDPSLVISIIAQTLGVQEVEGQTLLESITYYLDDKRVLLILDNFEHVTAAAPGIASLLAVIPHLNVLVTSRDVLNLPGEHVFEVRPLDLPDLNHLPSLDGLRQYPGVELFIQRVQAVKSDFTLTNENMRAVVELCHWLDGLPLMIELAAVWIEVLSPHELLKELQNETQLLEGSHQHRPSRHLTGGAVFNWSYELLSQSKKRLFARLAVFVGGWTTEAAITICSVAGDRRLTVLWGLKSLCDKHLIQQSSGRDNDPRFIMLNTIREHALAQLKMSEEADSIRRQHATYYLSLAQTAMDRLVEPQRQMGLERLEVEHDNLRAALKWALEHDAKLSMQLGEALARFWYRRGYWSEGRTWIEMLVKLPAAPATASHAALLSWSGYLIWRQEGNYNRAVGLLERALALCEELDNRSVQADILRRMGRVAREQGDHEQASIFLERALASCEEQGNEWVKADILRHMGLAAAEQKDYIQAITLLEQSLALCGGLEDKGCRARSLRTLGEVLRDQGEHQQATALLQESRMLFREQGEKAQTAWSCHILGELAQLQHDDEQARALYKESLTLFQELGAKSGRAWSLHNLSYITTPKAHSEQAILNLTKSLALFRELGLMDGISDCLVGLAGVIGRDKGRLEEAVWLLAAAETLRASHGIHMRPLALAHYDNIIYVLRTQLNEETFSAAWTQGQDMPLERVITIALRERSRDIGR